MDVASRGPVVSPSRLIGRCLVAHRPARSLSGPSEWTPPVAPFTGGRSMAAPNSAADATFGEVACRKTRRTGAELSRAPSKIGQPSGGPLSRSLARPAYLSSLER